MAKRLPLIALLATPLLGGCYVGEGDYVVFRVAVEEIQIADGCYDEDNPRPLEEELSNDSFLSPLTWVVYYGAGDKVILDDGSNSIGGEENTDGFLFTGHDIDVSYAGIDNLEAKVTVTTTTTVDVQQSGSAIQGEVLSVISITCDFLTATPSSGLCEAISNCEQRAKFAGVELDDVDIDTTINRPNPL